MACLNCRFGNRGYFTDFHLELLILVKNIQEFVSVNMFIEQIDNNPMNELTLTSFQIRHKCLRHHFLQNCVSPYGFHVTLIWFFCRINFDNTLYWRFQDDNFSRLTFKSKILLEVTIFFTPNNWWKPNLAYCLINE